MTTGKTIALTRWNFVHKVMSLLFNVLWVKVERSDRMWSTGGGNGKPLQYPCLENTMDRGAWQAAVHGVARSQATITVLVRVKFDAQRTVLHRNMEC